MEKTQSSQRETAARDLLVVERLDAKLPISRVILDLVEWVCSCLSGLNCLMLEEKF